MSMKSYSISLANEIFVLVTPRGSLARNQWGESWTRNVDDAYTVHGEAGAARAAKQINERLGKKEVTPEPIFLHMKLCWGFAYEKFVVESVKQNYNKFLTECVQRYFPREIEVISEPPNPHPDAQKYSYPRDKAFSDAKIAWEHLKAKRIYDLEYAQRSLDEINSDLRACEAALSPGEKAGGNVVSIKGNLNE